MIITETKSYEDIKSELNKDKKICLVSCNSCAKICKTGGKEKLEEFSNKLESDGFEVIDSNLIGIACNFEQMQKINFNGDIIIAFVCETGIHNLKKITDKEILIALKTIGIGTTDENGNIVLVKEF